MGDISLYMAGIVSTLLVGILVGLALEYFRAKAATSGLQLEITALQKENATLEKLVATLKAEKKDSEAANVAQKDKIAQYESREAILAKYVFVEQTGTYLEESTGLHYCTSCLKKTPLTEVPMKNGKYSWTCQVCTKTYYDPDRPRPPPAAAGQSW